MLATTPKCREAATAHHSSSRHGRPARRLLLAAVPSVRLLVLLPPHLHHHEKEPVKVAFCSSLGKKKKLQRQGSNTKPRDLILRWGFCFGFFARGGLFCCLFVFILNRRSCRPINSSPTYPPAPGESITRVPPQHHHQPDNTTL